REAQRGVGDAVQHEPGVEALRGDVFREATLEHAGLELDAEQQAQATHTGDARQRLELLDDRRAARFGEGRRIDGLHHLQHRARSPWKNAGSPGFTPPSPCTGSSRSAATDSSSARAKSSRSFHDAWRNPSGSGWNASCFSGWPVACNVASVRPWKLRHALTTT